MYRRNSSSQPLYKFEVLGTSWNEGIAEGTSDVFLNLLEAKRFVERVSCGSSDRFGNGYRSGKFILKYIEQDGEIVRYIKKVWILSRGKWHSTRKVSKYLMLMEL